MFLSLAFQSGMPRIEKAKTGKKVLRARKKVSYRPGRNKVTQRGWQELDSRAALSRFGKGSSRTKRKKLPDLTTKLSSRRQRLPGRGTNRIELDCRYLALLDKGNSFVRLRDISSRTVRNQPVRQAQVDRSSTRILCPIPLNVSHCYSCSCFLF